MSDEGVVASSDAAVQQDRQIVAFNLIEERFWPLRSGRASSP